MCQSECSANFNELYFLLEIQSNLKLQLSTIEEHVRIREDIQYTAIKQNKPDNFFSYILNNYLEREVKLNEDVHFLQSTLKLVEQQIKSVCVHEYVEDYIDNGPDSSQKITYCSLCYSTF